MIALDIAELAFQIHGVDAARNVLIDRAQPGHLAHTVLQALPAHRTTDYEETIVTITSTSGFNPQEGVLRSSPIS